MRTPVKLSARDEVIYAARRQVVLHKRRGTPVLEGIRQVARQPMSHEHPDRTNAAVAHRGQHSP
ncbi:hypothetical protein [Rhodococcus jostii]|uniref:hypothetical protein n=1 Tax=Rhodococcus jostii TaxID=132919 RepID=UPI0036349112